MDVIQTNLQEIKACGFKPEPHTVAFQDEGNWFAVKNGEKIVSCLCVKQMKNTLCMSNLYTLPEYRHRGIMTKLVDFVVNKVYAGRKMEAHCLKASREIVLAAGFHVESVVYFKHGTQWRMKRDGTK